ncbi:unnamed protein product, partial [marine sediment metagenome]
MVPAKLSIRNSMLYWDKRPSLWRLLLVPIICLGIFGGCAANDDDINGYYEYEETIYHNPA